MKQLMIALVMVVIPEVSAQLAQLPRVPQPELPQIDCTLVSCQFLACPVSQRFSVPGECCPRCRQGQDICATVLCAQPNCPMTETPPGQCCPVCVNRPDCALIRCIPLGCRESDRYTPPGACCQSCRPGSDICAVALCALPTNCPVTETPPGQCCPVCVDRPRSCTYNGLVYQNGETFMRDCNSCICTNGQALCTLMACPPRTCTYNGVVYEDGQTFMKDCNTCTCRNGVEFCTQMYCRSRTCLYRGEIFKDGEKFTDKCNTCKCYKGRALCTRKICPPTDCDQIDCAPLDCSVDEQITSPGQCCPVCGDPRPTCEKEGRVFRDGESVPSTSACEHCVCRNSNIICIIQSCPAPQWCEPEFIIHPVGQCCTVCADTPFPEPVAVE